MNFPSYLSTGDKVAIVSPAGKVRRQQVECGAELLRQQGFEVVIGRHVFDEDGVFAGSDEARAADLQTAFDDESVKAIFCSRGGYGCLRTHQLLDWSSFLRKPKWLVGFSDITVFHSFLARNHTASIHGVMTSFFTRDGAPTESFRMTMDMLRGQMPAYHVAPHPLNVPGSAAGLLTGGNLSILQSLRGTPLDLIPEGRILFIEDINEYRYHLDRMMQNLKTGGVLERLSGLIVGHFTKMKDGDTPFGLDTSAIIKEAVAPYGYPLVFGFPAGHELPNLPLVMGGLLSVEVSCDGASITVGRAAGV
jgi:muramoyltetrapeptide carboxypeptidase